MAGRIALAGFGSAEPLDFGYEAVPIAFVSLEQQKMSMILAFLALLVGQPGQDGRPVQLTVAVFPYLPDEDTALKRLESEFEAANRGVDLVLAQVDPYKIAIKDGKWVKDGKGEKPDTPLDQYDLIEIDLCRFDDVHGAVDPLPEGIVGEPSTYFGSAATALSRKGDLRRFFAPHWVCGVFLVTWSDDARLSTATSLGQIKAAIAGTESSALFVDYYGSTTLGEYYADAMVDLYGAQAAESHLRELGLQGSAKHAALNDVARAAVLSLFEELQPSDVPRLSAIHEAGGTELPQEFAKATRNGTAMLGYSERFYYAALESEAGLDSMVSIAPMSFGEKSQGTPTWVDGFVAPKGKVSSKSVAISAFISFATSHEGYAAFGRPDPKKPATYLLPAVSSEYDEQILRSKPALKKYMSAFDGRFPIDNSDVWRGIRFAGSVLEQEIDRMIPKPAAPRTP